MKKRRNRTCRSRRNSGRNLDFQSLEPKQLLAGISFDSGTGVVTVDGSNAADAVRVEVKSPTQIEVVFNGVGRQSFDKSDVTEVVFMGRSGDDWFRNSTSVPSKAYGHDGEDILIGGFGDDVLRGGNGKDRLLGKGGDDRVFGDGQDDILEGNSGDDVLRGGTGNDRTNGGSGNDNLYGDLGDDLILGGIGDDYARGGDGDDQIYGFDGTDRVFGDSGNDLLAGQNGDDFVFGNAGLDRIYGNSGKDRLEGGSDDDTLIGGADDDLIHGDDGNDRVLGQSGNDSIDGGQGDDVLQGDDGDDQIHGGDGDDTVIGSTGNDSLFGDAGRDRVVGNSGDDLLLGGLDDDVLFGHGGRDRIFGDDGDDSIYGGDDDDILRGGSGLDNLYGQRGSDDMHGNDGDDDLYGGLGSDSMSGDLGNDDYYRDDSDSIYDDADDHSPDGDFELRGPISNLDTTSKTFTILGITVNYSTASVHGTLANGQTFKAEGIFSSGVLGATEVEPAINTSDNFEAVGTIANLNTTAKTFTMFGIQVNYGSAQVKTTLADGNTVKVEGALAAGVVSAREVEAPESGDHGGGNGDNNSNQSDGKVEVYGNITNLDTTNKTFQLLGLTVNYAGAQISGQFQEGTFVKAEGNYDGSTIVAREVEQENPNDNQNKNFEAYGKIENLDAQAKTFDLLGFSVDYSNASLYTSLTNGLSIELEGMLQGMNVDAIKIDV